MGRRGAGALVAAGVLALVGFGIYHEARGDSAPRGRTLDYWIAAVPVVWNIAPNGHDAMAMAMDMSGSHGGMPMDMHMKMD